jgi:uncharacterized protein YecT (DUF1311 family)
MTIALFLAAFLPGAPAAVDQCGDAKTQADMNACHAALARRVSEQLDRIMAGLGKRLRPGQEKAFREAQAAWKGYRAAWCDFVASGVADGSVRPMVVAVCRSRMTEARIHEIEGIATCSEGDLSCPVLPGPENWAASVDDASAAAGLPQAPEPTDPLERHMGVLGIAVERTTLDGAQTILGKADVRHSGDAHASAYGECYVGPDGTVLALVAQGEYGGAEHRITDLNLVTRPALANVAHDGFREASKDARPRCAPLPRLSRATSTAGGLRLGLTPQEVRGLLGTPDESGRGHTVYRSLTGVPLPPPLRAELMANAGRDAIYGRRSRGLRVEFEKGRVVAIRLSQVTSPDD